MGHPYNDALVLVVLVLIAKLPSAKNTNWPWKLDIHHISIYNLKNGVIDSHIISSYGSLIGFTNDLMLATGEYYITCQSKVDYDNDKNPHSGCVFSL